MKIKGWSLYVKFVKLFIEKIWDDPKKLQLDDHAEMLVDWEILYEVEVLKRVPVHTIQH